MKKRVLSVLMAVTMLVGLIPANEDLVYAANKDVIEEVAPEPEAGSSAVAPEDYEAIYTEPSFTLQAEENEETDANILLIEDRLPWDSDANRQVLNSLNVKYNIATTDDFVSNVDLAQYDVVIFANDQGFETYENYAKFQEYLQKFAELGGVIVFGACDEGWADGHLSTNLPGGVTKKNEYIHNNYIVDNSHAIVTCELSDGNALENDDLYSNYCSHTSFDEESFPAGTNVILRDSESNRPTLIEYPLGEGRVIASGLTWEHNYALANAHNWGEFAEKCLDDLYLYALRVSKGTVKDLDRLEQYKINNNVHSIIVSDQDNMPIKDATVVVEGIGEKKTLTTDEKGSVYIDKFGKATVTVSAEGFASKSLIYTVKEKTARIVFLKKKSDNKLPYITMVEDTNNEKDLMTQQVYYRKSSREKLNLKMAADLNGKKLDHYKIYQLNSDNKEVTKYTSKDGNFTFTPGTDFAAGYIVEARVYATDGTSSDAVKVGVFVKNDKVTQNGGNITGLDDMNSFALFENQNATLTDNNAANILPTSWDVSADLLPVALSKVYDPDNGTYTYKGTVGFTEYSNDLLDESKDGEWKNFKQKVLDAKDKIGDRQKLLNDFKDKLSDREMESQIKVKFKAVGFFEIKLDTYGKVINQEGGIIVSGGATGTLGGTFMAGPVPLYYELSLGINADFKGGLKYTIVDGNGKLGLDGSITIDFPSITVGGGVGVYGAATAGIEGNGKLSMQLAPKFTGTLKMSAKAKVKVLFLAEFNWNLGNGWEHQLWPKENVDLCSMYDIPLEDAKLELASDTYLNKTTNWYGNRETLQSYVLPETMPELLNVNGQKVMLFQFNDGEEGNSKIKLKYSVMDDDSGKWSKPSDVSDDETNDLFYDVVETDNGAYVVWQNVSENVDMDEDVDEVIGEIAQKSEIYVAKWDATEKTFDEVTNISKNESLDMIPVVSANGNNVSIAWVNSKDNYVKGEAGKYTIMYATNASGEWNVSSCATVEKPVADLAVGNVDGLDVVLGNIDGVIYQFKGGTAKALTSADEECNGLRFDDGNIYWVQGGALKAFDGTNVETVLDETNAVAGDYRFVNRNGKKAIVWAKNGENEYTLQASVLIDNSWSKPVELYSQKNKNMAFFDVDFDEDGGWNLVANIHESSNSESASLIFKNIKEVSDVELNYIYASDNDVVNGKMPVTISVTNKGMKAVNNINVSITGNGTSFYDEDISCKILPGEEFTTDIMIDVSNIIDKTLLTVNVNTDDDDNDSNNTKTVEIGLADIELNLEKFITDKGLVVAAHITNVGKSKTGVTLQVYEDNKDGISIDMKNYGQLEPGEEIVCTYAFDKENIDFKELSSKSYMFMAYSSVSEYDYQNNSDYAVIYNDEFELQGENLYSISYELNGGAVEGNPLTYSETTETFTLKNPTLAGYVFEGWTGSNGDIPNKNVQIVKGTIGDLKFVANWKKSQNEPSPIGPGVTTPPSTPEEPEKPEKPGTEAEQITIKAASLEIAAGKKTKLTVRTASQTLAGSDVTWKSGNKKYAMVDANGIVTTKKTGAGKTVTITAVSKSDRSVKAAVKIRIMKNAVTKVKVKNPPKTLKAGTGVTLKASVTTNGKDANKTLKWTSSNTSYATVNAKGKVVAKKAGKGKTVTITAESTDGTNKKVKVKIKIK